MTVIAENRQARHNYIIEDTLEAGLVLEGWEVKSILAGRGNFGMGGAFVALKNGEAWLEGVQITPDARTQRSIIDKPEPYRSRKLLLRRNELDKLTRRVAERGLTVVPLDVHRSEHGKLKLSIGVARGKKLYDKRETLKARDIARDAARAS